jgi:hypothetical protein
MWTSLKKLKHLLEGLDNRTQDLWCHNNARRSLNSYLCWLYWLWRLAQSSNCHGHNGWHRLTERKKNNVAICRSGKLVSEHYGLWFCPLDQDFGGESLRANAGRLLSHLGYLYVSAQGRKARSEVFTSMPLESQRVTNCSRKVRRSTRLITILSSSADDFNTFFKSFHLRAARLNELVADFQQEGSSPATQP